MIIFFNLIFFSINFKHLLISIIIWLNKKLILINKLSKHNHVNNSCVLHVLDNIPFFFSFLAPNYLCHFNLASNFEISFYLIYNSLLTPGLHSDSLLRLNRENKRHIAKFGHLFRIVSMILIMKFMN